MAGEKFEKEFGSKKLEAIDFSDEMRELEELKGLIGKANEYLINLEKQVDTLTHLESSEDNNPFDLLLAELNSRSTLGMKFQEEMMKQNEVDRLRYVKYLKSLNQEKYPGAAVALKDIYIHDANIGRAEEARILEDDLSDVSNFYGNNSFIRGLIERAGGILA